MAVAGVGLAAGLPDARAALPSLPLAPPVPVPTLGVRAFGATGDGRADDTAAVQRAIDAALRTGGGCVHFPAGRYRISRTLRVKSADRIDFTGDGTSSVLLHEANEHLLAWETGASFREGSVRDLCFISAARDKSPDVAVIACLGGCERSLFSHLLFLTDGATMGSGIFMDQVADTTTFDNCVLWGPVGGTGIRVARGSEVRIFGGRVLGSRDPYKGLTEGNIGIHLTGDNGGVHIVTTDLIGLHTGLLIGSPGAKSNREIFITHATFDSSTHGIRQRDGAYTSIAGCWAASSDEDQILLERTAEGAIMSIAGGTIFNGGAYGRPGAKNGFVAHAGSFMLSGVTVRNNQGAGLLIGPAVRDYTVTGCRIVENGTGARLAGDGYTFTGNVLARNNTHLVDGGGPNKVVQANVTTPATP
jgi:hypothetical protein